MTAFQIAKDHCANWQADGTCLGAEIDDDLQIRRCHPKPRCLLAESRKRCLYFEQCVAPMAPGIDNEAHRAQFEAAVRDYCTAADCSVEPVTELLVEQRDRWSNWPVGNTARLRVVNF
jgi:hypothetical protein